MSLIAARKKRTTLYLSIAGLMVMVAAVSAISARDADGVTLRIGMIMVTVGAGLWLPWRQLVPAAILAWLVPNLGRSFVDDAVTLGNVNMLLELPGLAGIAFFTASARDALKKLEDEDILIGTGNSEVAGLNPETGIFDANQLRPSLEAELARSRRFGRTFALVLVGLDEMRQKFDYRDEVTYKLSHDATARLLRQTRQNVDRVYHYKSDGFAIILPESIDKDIPGLVKRLRSIARDMKPAEGEPGGPMAVHFGATFFPECATTVDDLLRRGEIALKIAASSTTRYQVDSAEAPEMPPAETLRREAVEAAVATAPSAEATPPPALTNPVAAAIVEEAYADRTRESNVAEPVSELTAEAVAVSEALPITETPPEPEAAPAYEAPIETVTPVPEAAQLPDLSSGPVSNQIDADLFQFPPAAPEPVEPEAPVLPEPTVAERYEVAEAPAPAPKEPVLEPVLASAGAMANPEASDAAVQPLAAPVSAAAEVADDFEALLKQMDETLKMIKSVRNSAA